MIDYSDLLFARYKPLGRWHIDRTVDCYGLVLECVRRQHEKDGTPLLRDLIYEDTKIPQDYVDANYVCMLNLDRIDGPEEGALVEMRMQSGDIHCGYMVDKERVLHTTEKGVRLTPVGFYHVIGYFRTRSE